MKATVLAVNIRQILSVTLTAVRARYAGRL